MPNINENDFSLGNQGGSGTNFCHEIMVRIYYPTSSSVTSPVTPYYYPRVLQLQNSLNGAPGISESQIAALPSTLWSWTLPNVSILPNAFPVILFSPGNLTPAQGYEDYITNLVSYGYIVVGINSVFVNGYIQLPNGVIVYNNSQQSMTQSTRLQENDLELVYNQIKSSSNNTDKIFAKMDLLHIGAYGHSDGAYSIVQVANQNPSLFQAVALMDEGVELDNIANYLKPITNPVLYLVSSYIYNAQAKLDIPLQPLVKSTSYRTVITPNLLNINYSAHSNFADDTTLQYNPVMNIYYSDIREFGGMPVGTINGYTMIQYASNDYVIQFFNTFLKNQSSTVFNTKNCNPLSSNTLLQCGAQ